ncbi:MAG: hypothetical protein JWQ90_1694 [Hydrocarboniphaga sp.]|uniref:hypothetical protein n=1 Tax=Hydrocarboniphaga sp. TaxID=2033016 RepID=UPI002637C90D|nr:hypothetical protein [Hydrocarboniphaga sp.]MDB5969244.1 hypothetical protein [Hydrocarboniphaga sp.]
MADTIGRQFPGWVLGVMLSGAAQAQGSALTLPELQRCASQVQQLRQDSARLTQQSRQLDAERSAIMQRTDELNAEQAKLSADDLKNGLALHERRKSNQQQALALNTRVVPLRREIDTLNLLKTDYDRNCSSRPYRRADLDTLPEAQRSAMRAGMGDVQVPYIDPAPPASADTP